MNFLQKVYTKRWEDPELERVSKVWQALTESFFQKIIGENAKVLDIGCGFCYFLNHLRAQEKVGIDANPAAKNYAAKDVNFILTDDLRWEMLPNEHFDYVFLSNFLEHMDNSRDVIAVLERVRELLIFGGRIIILQPNFRLLGPAYFDYIDHKTILTDKSIAEALHIAGLKIERKIIRFLPYTTKSRLPQNSFLIRIYLWFRPMWLILGKQSLFIAVKNK
jgi:SAM-dependent methyltransferase